MITDETPFLYRFRSTRESDGTLRIYGPRPFLFVLQRYGETAECEARPENSPETAWAELAEWRTQYQPPPPAPATDRQLTRLRNLEVPVPEDLSEAAARELIRDAEAKLPPTSAAAEKARKLGIVLGDGETRESLKEKMDDHARASAAKKLRRSGADVSDSAGWQELEDAEERLRIEKALSRQGIVPPPGLTTEALEELEYLRSDLKEAAAGARQAGIKYRFERGTTSDEAQRHLRGLWAATEFWEEHHWKCDERSSTPTLGDVREAAAQIYKDLAEGTRSLEEAKLRGVARLETSGAGCFGALLVAPGLGLSLLMAFIRWSSSA